MSTRKVVLRDAENMNEDQAIWLIAAEWYNQFCKWGIKEHEINEWLNFTTEELGELAKAISEYKYRLGQKDEIVKEAVQVAALALKIALMVSDYRETQ